MLPEVNKRIECLAVVVTDSKEDIVVSALVSVIHPDSIDVVARDEDLRVTRDSSIITQANNRVECLAVIGTCSKEYIINIASGDICKHDVDVVARDEHLKASRVPCNAQFNRRVECLTVIGTCSKEDVGFKADVVSSIFPGNIDVVTRYEHLLFLRPSSSVAKINNRVECLTVIGTRL